MGDGYNVHSYCGNDPVNYTDPSGLFSFNNLFGDLGKIIASVLGASNSSSSSSGYHLSASLNDSGWYYGSVTGFDDMMFRRSSSSDTSFGSFGSIGDSNITFIPMPIGFFGSSPSATATSVNSGGIAGATSTAAIDPVAGAQETAQWMSYVPGANVPAAAVDASISFYQGEYVAGGIAAVGAIPFGKWVTKGGKSAYVVYQGLDKAGGIRYVGITSRNAAIRFAEHKSAINTGRELLDYKVIQGATGLSRIQARIWEQSLIIKYGLQKDGGQLFNKINSIAEENWSKFGL